MKFISTFPFIAFDGASQDLNNYHGFYSFSIKHWVTVAEAVAIFRACMRVSWHFHGFNIIMYHRL